jgi:hypothetical protein
MGTGIDAYDQGARMGIAAANTISTGTTRAEVHASFAAAGASSMRFASGEAHSTAYLASERAAAGDRFSHQHGPVAGVPTSPTQGLWAPRASTKPSAPAKRQTISDISL